MSKLVLAVPNFPGKTKIMAATSKAAIKVAKHSPELCVGGGIALGIGATVLACRATLKVNSIMEKHLESEDMHNIRHFEEKLQTGEEVEGYSLQDVQRDKFIVYTRLGVDLIKVYAPAFVLGAASICLILGGHRILARRNAALSVAYAGLQKAYDEYRQRVRDEFGEEKEQDIYRGVREVTVEETNDKGKTVKKKAHEQIGPASPYTRIFDESSCWWKKDPEMNKFFLATQQRHANDLLRLNGYLFLNDVLKMLDLTPSAAGQQVGWVYGEGDSFISFGMWDAEKEQTRRFINGDERSIWLDFNVDGVIYDKIDELERRKLEVKREQFMGLT